jgi:hypothetical protein
LLSADQVSSLWLYSILEEDLIAELVLRRRVSNAPLPLSAPTQEPKQHPMGGAGIPAVPPQQQKKCVGLQTR